MARLKLAIYLPDLSGGGVERMRLNLAPKFVELGYDVTFVLHEKNGELVNQVPASIGVVSLGAKRTLQALPRLITYLKSEKPDILLSSLGHNNINAIWAAKIAGTRTRLIVCQHNAMSSETQGMANWQHKALPFLCKIFFRWADDVVCVSKGVADDLSRISGIPRGRITVIYNPVIFADFKKKASAAVDAQVFSTDGSPYFTAIGRLVHQKDFGTLLRAFAEARKVRDVRLLILGEGPLRPDLEALARSLGIVPWLHMPGYVQSPLPYLALSAGLVMSSRYEGFGNVIVEALGCGTPVISTDCPHGPAEILDGGRYGILVPVGATGAVADAMVKVLDCPPPKEQLRSRAEEFHVDRIALEYQKLFLGDHVPAAV